MALVLTYHLMGAVFIFAPLRMFGKSVYALLPALFLLVALVWVVSRPPRRELVLWRPFTAAIGVVWWSACVIIARDIVYDEPIRPLNYRYIPLLFVMILLGANTVRQLNRRDLMAKLLVWATFVQALIGIVHSQWFSYINLAAGTDEPTLSFDAFATREAGTLFNANAYGSMLFCGMLLLTFYPFRTGLLRRPTIQSILIAMLGYAVALSGSRYPMGVAAATAVFFVYCRLLSRSNPGLSVLRLGVVVAALFLAVLRNFDGRMDLSRLQDTSSGGRVEMASISLGLLTANFWAPVIGTTTQSVVEARTSDEHALSDNSYLAIGMQFGFPLLFSWFYVVYAFFRRWLRFAVPLFVFLCFVIDLLVTNGILWDPWLFYFVLTFFCIAFAAEERAQRMALVRRVRRHAGDSPRATVSKGCGAYA